MGTVEEQPLKTAKQMVGREMMVAFFILFRSMAISLAFFRGIRSSGNDV